MSELLAPALAACVVLTVVLGYFGLHVLMREVIFVDLALAQLAALGAAAARALLPESPEPMVYACSFGLTLVGAGLFAGIHSESRRVPQEALIGIVYGVSAALVVLVLSKSALERDEIEHMLTGHLLFVDWTELGVSVALCALVGIVHMRLGARFLARSRRARGGAEPGRQDRWLDFVFYASFGAIVTSSVQIAGVLVVFSLLIVPAACAALFFSSIRRRLLTAWGIGASASVAGIAASAFWDLPTGPAVVAALGAAFTAALASSALR